MRAAVDTNVLVYAEERSAKGDRARRLMASAPPDRMVLPVQVCGELYNVLTHKAGFAATEAIEIVDAWRRVFDPAETAVDTMSIAFELVATHRLSIWDAIILAAAAETQCDLLLSEDLQSGFRWRGVTVVNPFIEPTSPLLEAFLDQAGG